MQKKNFERRPGGLDNGPNRNDVLDHSVGKVFLLRVAAHIVERKDCDRKPLRHDPGGDLAAFISPDTHPPDRHTRIGSAMFFRLWYPPSSNDRSSLARTCRKVSSEMQTPPGVAIASSRESVRDGDVLRVHAHTAMSEGSLGKPCTWPRGPVATYTRFCPSSAGSRDSFKAGFLEALRDAWLLH